MPEATDWDLWNAELVGGPEARGSRRAAELVAMKEEHARNFARACEAANQHYHRWHSEQPVPYRSATHYASERQLMERLGIGSA